ncbi:MAG: GHKL domain-containing protein [Tissierellia bacterium]|jgi:two-component system sensor histidine kinase AgrC|nr:GHKL domain-containing protein [Tissierellia bacterium]
MDNIELILKAVLNIVSVISAYILNITFLGKSKKSKVLIGISYALFYFIITFTYLYIGLPYIMSLSFILGLIGVAFLHSNSLIKNISTAVLIFAIFIVVENAIGAMLVKGDLNYFEKVKYDTITLISIIKFATLGVSISIYSFFSKKINIELPSKYYFVLPLIIFLSAILTTFLLSNYDLAKINISFTLIIIIMINYIIFSMYDDILNLFEEKSNAISLEKQYELIRTQSENIEKSADELRRLEHDLKNKLTPIAFMVKDENIDQASEYIQDIMAEFSSKRVLKSSGITELDSIINIKMIKCDDLDIEFEYEISPMEKAFVNNMDLAVMAGILLDNAIEATLKVSQKWIKADIRIVKGVLIIEIENTFDGVVKKDGNRFLTRKENKEYHGMGIRNIESILKKYDGEITFDYTGNVFKALVIVYPR